jgi:hypothetical protein
LIEPAWLRWTIYLWCWVLIDLQTLATSDLARANYGHSSMLPRSLPS